MASFKTICCHEAAHAVMRHLNGMPPGFLWVSETEGENGGTGEVVDASDELAVQLAGVAWECGFNSQRIDWSASKMSDLEMASALLTERPFLRGWRIVETAGGSVAEERSLQDGLRYALACVCDRLKPHRREIEALGDLLAIKREMDGRAVGDWMQTHIPLV